MVVRTKELTTKRPAYGDSHTYWGVPVLLQFLMI